MAEGFVGPGLCWGAAVMARRRGSVSLSGRAKPMSPHESSFWRIFFTQGILGSAQISRSLTVTKLEGGENEGALACGKSATALLWKLSVYESLTVCRDAHRTESLSMYEAPAVCKHTSSGGEGEKSG